MRRQPPYSSAKIAAVFLSAVFSLALAGHTALSAQTGKQAASSSRSLEGKVRELQQQLNKLQTELGNCKAHTELLSSGSVASQALIACHAEIKKYCPDIEVGDGRLKKCLEDKPDLSPDCKARITPPTTASPPPAKEGNSGTITISAAPSAPEPPAPPAAAQTTPAKEHFSLGGLFTPKKKH